MSAEVRAIFGMRGMGKTTLGRHMLKSERRVIVFDPVGEFARTRGFTRCDTLEHVRARLAKGWAKGFRLAWPVGKNHIAALHGLSDLIWRAQAPFETGAETRPILIVVEEMNLGYPAQSIPRDRQGFTQLVLQGRHRGIGVLGITQRPALVSPNFRSMAARTYIFRLEDEQDIVSMRRRIGPSREALLRALKQFDYLELAAGEVTQGRTKRG